MEINVSFIDKVIALQNKEYDNVPAVISLEQEKIIVPRSSTEQYIFQKYISEAESKGFTLVSDEVKGQYYIRMFGAHNKLRNNPDALSILEQNKVTTEAAERYNEYGVWELDITDISYSFTEQTVSGISLGDTLYSSSVGALPIHISLNAKILKDEKHDHNHTFAYIYENVIRTSELQKNGIKLYLEIPGVTFKIKITSVTYNQGVNTGAYDSMGIELIGWGMQLNTSQFNNKMYTTYDTGTLYGKR